MKKNFIILTILLATAIHSLAQDTITGVVNRVAAPYFEQNVCDSRFALTTGDPLLVWANFFFSSTNATRLLASFDIFFPRL